MIVLQDLLLSISILANIVMKFYIKHYIILYKMFFWLSCIVCTTIRYYS